MKKMNLRLLIAGLAIVVAFLALSVLNPEKIDSYEKCISKYGDNKSYLEGQGIMDSGFPPKDCTTSDGQTFYPPD